MTLVFVRMRVNNKSALAKQVCVLSYIVVHTHHLFVFFLHMLRLMSVTHVTITPCAVLRQHCGCFRNTGGVLQNYQCLKDRVSSIRLKELTHKVVYYGIYGIYGKLQMLVGWLVPLKVPSSVPNPTDKMHHNFMFS